MMRGAAIKTAESLLHTGSWMPDRIIKARFIEPMLLPRTDMLPSGRDMSFELKWDGYRALLMKDARGTRLLSRNLKDLTSDYLHIAAAAADVSRESMMLDGEIVALDEHGRPSFQALQHRSVTRSAVVFYTFDLLHLDGESLLDRSLA